MAAGSSGQDRFPKECADFAGGSASVFPWSRVPFELCSRNVPTVAGQGVSLADAVANGMETNCATVRKTLRKFREEFVAELGEAVVMMMTDPAGAAKRIRTCEYRSRAQFGAVVAPILEARREAEGNTVAAKKRFRMPACFQRALDKIKTCAGPARAKGQSVKYDDLVLVNGLADLSAKDYELVADKYERLYGLPLSAVLATANFVIQNLDMSVDDMATEMGMVGPMTPEASVDDASPYANASVMII